MKFSVAWLAELAGVEFEVEELAARLTAAGLEVDSIESVQAGFSGVVVAKIIDCQPHPQADKLQICHVDDGSGQHVQIVCGAPNVRAGLLAPLARIGAELPGGLKIEQATLRGETSFGMLCSASELLLDEDASGLMELGDDAVPGVPLEQMLGLHDHVIDVDLTPNRADCLSMHGLVSEVAALYQLQPPARHLPQVSSSVQARIDCSVADPTDCPRYALRIVSGIDNRATTPVWMSERLRRAGLRSKSPVVDVTNYVMLEYGQPLHAFDRQKLPAAEPLRVRRARPQETMQLLNGDSIKMDASYLLIVAADQPQALAGVMGAAESCVDVATREVVLESAWFAPEVIIGKTRDLGISSEAAHRFERGIDPGIQLQAMERATELLVQIAGGQAGPVNVTEAPELLPQPAHIRLRCERVSKLLGKDIAGTEIAALLRSLGMQVDEEPQGRSFMVQPPAARLDLQLEIDLIEEVARLHGYNQLPTADPAGRLRLQAMPEAVISSRRLQSMCADLGYQEVVNFSFLRAGLLQACYPQREPVALANPISSDLSHMRTGLLPGLLQSLQHNLNNKHGRYRQSVRLFETGTVFNADDEQHEQQYLALLATGSVMPEQWGMASRALDFYDFKGDVEHLLGLNANEFEFRTCANHACLHPGQAAEIIKNDQHQTQSAGFIGRLHPRLCQQLELPKNTFVTELKMSAIKHSLLPNAVKISKFPTIRRDLALIVPDTLAAGELLASIRAMGGELLRELHIFDLYQGEGIETDHKSLAIGLIMQDSCKTLTDERADKLIAEIVQGLKQKHGVELRQA
ncbi:MAG: phenylalanine--tRNA ligase subunit beta [Gammaproteobacteria bacterium]|jgi:phenylalanyl-tRNA synthetase beta chain|nr:phenylalanine--tRNA ligase subunit beta [Gammaproteobacteria bacterium]